MNRSQTLAFIIYATLFMTSCNNAPAQKNISAKKDSAHVAIIRIGKTADSDSTQLTNLIRALYKWVDTNKTTEPNDTPFNPVKKNSKDAFYSGIDLTAHENAIKKLRATGMFAEDFLNDYRSIAVRMNTELGNGKSSWRVGELPSFQDDVNEWCSCQDEPEDNY